MTDVLIIGDGIIGRSVAFDCVRAGYQTTILTKNQPYSATQAAGGMLTPSAEIETAEKVLIQFAQESCSRYPSFVTEVEKASELTCEYSRHGTLLLALHRDHQNDLSYLAQAQRAAGMKVAELTRREVLQKEPNLHHQVVGGLYAQNDHHVNPRALHNALGQALAKSGVHTITASSITLHHDQHQLAAVEYTREEVCSTINTDSVILCAGAWTNDLLPETLKLPAKPIKGQYVRLTGESLIQEVVRTPDVYLVPRPGGEIYIGATAEDQGFNHHQTAGGIMELLYHAWRAVPGTYEMKIVEQGVGFRPSLRDNLPAVGPTPIEGLLLATGHYRHGIMLAPQTSQLVLDILAKRTNPFAEAFSPMRFWKKHSQSRSFQEVA